MAILNKLTSIFPAFGNATEYLTLTGQNAPINAATTFVLNNFVNYVRSGRVRVKNSATGGAGSQITGITITGTDGTNTVTLLFSNTTYTANTFIDRVFDFLSDLNINSISITITNANAGAASTWDFEVAGNP